MLNRIFVFIGIAFALLATSAPAAVDVAEGRFVGTAKFADGTIQIAELDLIPMGGDQTVLNYVGLLKLTFGIPPTHEYVTFRFPKVRRTVGENTLTFDPWEQDIGLEDVVVDWSTQRLSARATNPGKDAGFDLKVSRDGKFHDEGFVRSTLEGVYQASCRGDEHPDRISIVTARGFQESPMSPNPFGVYGIFGATARWSFDFRGGPDTYHAYYPFSGGVYDFLSGELTLLGGQYFSCKTDARGISCDDCLYLSENGPPTHTADVAWDQLAKQSPPPSEISVAPTPALEHTQVFKGYVNHDALGISQKLELSLNFKQDAKTKAWTGSAIANLLFERAEQNPVRLTYRFQPQPFSTLAVGTTFFQIPTSFAPADAVVHITRFDGTTAEGNWYSWMYGYVGKFKATRDTQPLAPTHPKSMAALDGVYDGGVYPIYQARYLVGVQSIPGRFFPRSENPFFPMTFGGYMMVNSGLTPGIHQRFTEGALDFYTGRFNLGNYFVGNVDLGSPRPEFKAVDMVRTSSMGFIPRVDPSGFWHYSMPFRVFRKPADYWPRTDGWSFYR